MIQHGTIPQSLGWDSLKCTLYRMPSNRHAAAVVQYMLPRSYVPVEATHACLLVVVYHGWSSDNFER